MITLSDEQQRAAEERNLELLRRIDERYPDGKYDLNHEMDCFYVQHMTVERAIALRKELIDSGDAAPEYIDLLDNKLAGKTVSDIPRF